MEVEVGPDGLARASLSGPPPLRRRLVPSSPKILLKSDKLTFA
jgi:hypothetical protein